MISLYDILEAANGQPFGEPGPQLFNNFCIDARMAQENGRGANGGRRQPFQHAEGPEYARRIGRELETRADLLEGAASLVQPHRDVEPAEGYGGRHARDATARDQDRRRVRVAHVEAGVRQAAWSKSAPAGLLSCAPSDGSKR